MAALLVVAAAAVVPFPAALAILLLSFQSVEALDLQESGQESLYFLLYTPPLSQIVSITHMLPIPPVRWRGVYARSRRVGE